MCAPSFSASTAPMWPKRGTGKLPQRGEAGQKDGWAGEDKAKLRRLTVDPRGDPTQKEPLQAGPGTLGSERGTLSPAHSLLSACLSVGD